jgi:hypothetical protein
VTDVPAQIEEADAAMLTNGVTAAFTVIVRVFEVAVGVNGQVAVEVITQET